MGIQLQVTAAQIDEGVQKALSEVDGKAPKPAVNTQTGTAYTLVAADAFKVVEMDNASANTLTIPGNAVEAFEVNDYLDVVQTGAGLTTIQADTNVTLNGVLGGSVDLLGQYKAVSLYQRAIDEWIAIGNA